MPSAGNHDTAGSWIRSGPLHGLVVASAELRWSLRGYYGALYSVRRALRVAELVIQHNRRDRWAGLGLRVDRVDHLARCVYARLASARDSTVSFGR